MYLQISDLKKELILKKGILHFDFTASALALKMCRKRNFQKILPTYANTHSDSSLNSFKTQQIYEQARKDIKKVYH